MAEGATFFFDTNIESVVGEILNGLKRLQREQAALTNATPASTLAVGGATTDAGTAAGAALRKLEAVREAASKNLLSAGKDLTTEFRKVLQGLDKQIGEISSKHGLTIDVAAKLRTESLREIEQQIRRAISAARIDPVLTSQVGTGRVTTKDSSFAAGFTPGGASDKDLIAQINAATIAAKAAHEAYAQTATGAQEIAAATARLAAATRVAGSGADEAALRASIEASLRAEAEAATAAATATRQAGDGASRTAAAQDKVAAATEEWVIAARAAVAAVDKAAKTAASTTAAPTTIPVIPGATSTIPAGTTAATGIPVGVTPAQEAQAAAQFTLYIDAVTAQAHAAQAAALTAQELARVQQDALDDAKKALVITRAATKKAAAATTNTPPGGPLVVINPNAVTPAQAAPNAAATAAQQLKDDKAARKQANDDRKKQEQDNAARLRAGSGPGETFGPHVFALKAGNAVDTSGATPEYFKKVTNGYKLIDASMTEHYDLEKEYEQKSAALLVKNQAIAAAKAAATANTAASQAAAQAVIDKAKAKADREAEKARQDAARTARADELKAQADNATRLRAGALPGEKFGPAVVKLKGDYIADTSGAATGAANEYFKRTTAGYKQIDALSDKHFQLQEEYEKKIADAKAKTATDAEKATAAADAKAARKTKTDAINQEQANALRLRAGAAPGQAFGANIIPLTKGNAVDTTSGVDEFFLKTRNGFKLLEATDAEFFALELELRRKRAAAAGRTDAADADATSRAGRQAAADQRRAQRDADDAEKTRAADAARDRLSNLYTGGSTSQAGTDPLRLREGVTQIGNNYFKEIQDGTTTYFKAVGKGLRDITNEANELANALRVEAREGANKGLLGNFVHGFTSGGIGSGGEDGFNGLARSAGTTVKYSLLYSTLGLLQGALSGVGAQMLNFEDSNTNLQIALDNTKATTQGSIDINQDFIGSLESIAGAAGVNVGDVMDVAASGVRTLGDASGYTKDQIQDMAITFAQQVQTMAVLSKTTLLDSLGNTRAIAGAFNIPITGISRINDALVTAKNVGHGDEKQTSQALATFGEAATVAGFSPELAGTLASRVQALTDETGQSVGNKLSRLTTITAGTAGQKALATINTTLPAANKIDLNANVATQLTQLSAAYKLLNPDQLKFITNALAGTGASKELLVTLQNLGGPTGLASKDLTQAGVAADEYQLRLRDLTQTVRDMQGAFAALVVNVALSHVLDPLVVVFKAFVGTVQSISNLVGEFDQLPDLLKKSVVYGGELVALFLTLGKIRLLHAGDTAIGAGLAGRLNPERELARLQLQDRTAAAEAAKTTATAAAAPAAATPVPVAAASAAEDTARAGHLPLTPLAAPTAAAERSAATGALIARAEQSTLAAGLQTQIAEEARLGATAAATQAASAEAVVAAAVLKANAANAAVAAAAGTTEEAGLRVSATVAEGQLATARASLLVATAAADNAAALASTAAAAEVITAIDAKHATALALAETSALAAEAGAAAAFEADAQAAAASTRASAAATEVTAALARVSAAQAEMQAVMSEGASVDAVFVASASVDAAAVQAAAARMSLAQADTAATIAWIGALRAKDAAEALAATAVTARTEATLATTAASAVVLPAAAGAGEVAAANGPLFARVEQAQVAAAEQALIAEDAQIAATAAAAETVAAKAAVNAAVTETEAATARAFEAAGTADATAANTAVLVAAAQEATARTNLELASTAEKDAALLLVEATAREEMIAANVTAAVAALDASAAEVVAVAAAADAVKAEAVAVETGTRAAALIVEADAAVIAAGVAQAAAEAAAGTAQAAVAQQAAMEAQIFAAMATTEADLATVLALDSATLARTARTAATLTAGASAEATGASTVAAGALAGGAGAGGAAVVGAEGAVVGAETAAVVAPVAAEVGLLGSSVAAVTALFSPLILVIGAAIAGFVAVGAILGRLKNADDANKAAKSTETLVATIPQMSPTDQSQAYLDAASAATTAATDLKAAGSGVIGALTPGDHTKRIAQLKQEAATWSAMSASIDDQQKHLASNLNLITVFGDPAALTTEKLAKGMSAMAQAGASAQDSVIVLSKLLGLLDPKPGQHAPVDTATSTAKIASDVQKFGLDPAFTHQMTEAERLKTVSASIRAHEGPSNLELLQPPSSTLRGLTPGQPFPGFTGPGGKIPIAQYDLNPAAGFLDAHTAEINTILGKELPKTVTDAQGRPSVKQATTIADHIVAKMMPDYNKKWNALSAAGKATYKSPATFSSELKITIANSLRSTDLTSGLPVGQKIPDAMVLSNLTDPQGDIAKSDAAIADLQPGDTSGQVSGLNTKIKIIAAEISKGDTQTGTGLHEALVILHQAQAARATAVIAQLEEQRKAEMAAATDPAQIKAIGQRFFKTEALRALRDHNFDALKNILNLASDADVQIVRDTLADKLRADEAVLAAEKKKSAAYAAANPQVMPGDGRVGEHSGPGTPGTGDGRVGEHSGPGTSASSGVPTTYKSPAQIAAEAQIAADKANNANWDKTVPSTTQATKDSSVFDKKPGQDAENTAVRNRYAESGATLDAATRAVNDAKIAFDLLEPRQDGYQAAYTAYVQAQRALAKEIAIGAQHIKNELSIDTTNPVSVAQEELTNARNIEAEANASAKSGTTKYASPAAKAAYLGGLHLDTQSKEWAAQSAAQTQWMSNLQTAETLGRISHTSFINFLKGRSDQLGVQIKAMHAGEAGLQQLKDEKDAVDLAMKSAADSLSGVFNIGDIKVPTPYEVRRAIKEKYSGDVLASNGSYATAGNVTNDNSTRNVILNGVPIQQVMQMIEEQLGKKARSTANRKVGR